MSRIRIKCNGSLEALTLYSLSDSREEEKPRSKSEKLPRLSLSASSAYPKLFFSLSPSPDDHDDTRPTTPSSFVADDGSNSEAEVRPLTLSRRDDAELEEWSETAPCSLSLPLPPCSAKGDHVPVEMLGEQFNSEKDSHEM